jgi:hypothetical protein
MCINSYSKLRSGKEIRLQAVWSFHAPYGLGSWASLANNAIKFLAENMSTGKVPKIEEQEHV